MKNGQKEPTPFSDFLCFSDKKNRPFFPIFGKKRVMWGRWVKNTVKNLQSRKISTTFA